MIAPEVILRNTVTDADGDKANVTFEVYTANADGTPGTKVKLTDANTYGVLVSPFVASGSTAQVQVEYGRLKPRTDYLVHTSAFDGSLYETNWSPWARFRIDPYVTFPVGQSSSGIDSTAQTIEEFTRTNPGAAPAAAVASSSSSSSSSEGVSSSAPAFADFDKKNCSTADKKGRKLCFDFHKSDKARKVQRPEPGKTRETTQNFSTPGGNPAVDLVDWCTNAADGLDYMNRTEACLKDLGEETCTSSTPTRRLRRLGGRTSSSSSG